MKIDRYKKDLERLIKTGHELHVSLILEVEPDAAKRMGVKKEDFEEIANVRQNYQAWYSESLSLIRQLLPDRSDDFISYFKPLKPRKEIDISTYTVSDFLRGLEVSQGGRSIVGLRAAEHPLHQQVLIVATLKQRLESSLFDIKTLVQAELLDDELDAADELNGKGYARAAGVVAGVVLEGHLATVTQQHSLAVAKNPSISDLNDILKKSNLIDVPVWRFIQHLGDLRNLCGHKKDVEPTKDQVKELIAGVRKIIKTVF